MPSGRRAKLRATAGPLKDARGNVNGIVFVADEDTSSPKLEALADNQVRLRDALRRYLGDNVADMVDARPSFVDVGGQTQTVSVVHVDVRGYTAIAEQLPPDRVVSLLALWNAPVPQEDHVRRALRGALAMRDAALEVGTDLGYGIGVHTGEAMVGNLGSEQYQNFTAIGDTVNVAARLQGQAKAGEVVCSAVVLQAAGEGVRTTPLGALELKGRKTPVEAYRVEGIDQ